MDVSAPQVHAGDALTIALRLENCGLHAEYPVWDETGYGNAPAYLVRGERLWMIASQGAATEVVNGGAMATPPGPVAPGEAMVIRLSWNGSLESRCGGTWCDAAPAEPGLYTLRSAAIWSDRHPTGEVAPRPVYRAEATIEVLPPVDEGGDDEETPPR